MAEKKKGDKKGKGKKESKEPPALQPTFKGHAGVVSAVCFANETLFTGGWDNAVKAWDLKTDEEKINFEGHTGGIMSLKFEAGLLWSASLDKSVRTWDSKSGVCRDVVKFPGSCLALDVDPNSFYVASDDVVYVANVKTKDVEAELRGHTNIIVCMKLHNGKLYTGSWDLTIRIWSPQRQCCERVLTGHTDYITSLCVQSHSLYSSALDSTVRIWDIEDGNCLTVIQCEEVPQCLAVEGNELLAGMQEGDVVMWDNRTFATKHVFVGHAEAVRSIVIWGGRFFTGSKDKTAKRWDTEDSTTKKPEEIAAAQEKASKEEADKKGKKNANKKGK